MRVQPGGPMMDEKAVRSGLGQGHPDSDGSNPSISAEGRPLGEGDS